MADSGKVDLYRTVRPVGNGPGLRTALAWQEKSADGGKECRRQYYDQRLLPEQAGLGKKYGGKPTGEEYQIPYVRHATLHPIK